MNSSSRFIRELDRRRRAERFKWFALGLLVGIAWTLVLG